MAIRPEDIARMHGKANQRYAPKARKAGDKLPVDMDKVIEEVRELARKEQVEEAALESAIQDATVYLNRQYGIEDQFMSAGLNPTQARMVEALEELDGRGVPQSMNVPIRGGELRVHTRYGTNPMTGQQEIVPYIDAGTGQVLTTNYGDSRTGNIDMAGYHKASEYVQDRAMRLMGLAPQQNNSVNVTGVDFMVNGRGVDGEIREDFEARNRNIPIQIYTKATTPSTKGGDAKVIARAVDAVIRDELRQRGGNVMDATERAYQGRKLRDAIEGKVMKDDIETLLMTTLRSEDARANKATKDKLALAPQEVRRVDMQAAYDYINNMTAADTLRGTGGRSVLQVRPNYGDPNSRNREGRGRVYIRVPENAPGVSYDVADRFPHVAQLY